MCDEAPIDLISGGYDFSTDDLESIDFITPISSHVGDVYNAKPVKADYMVNNNTYTFSDPISYI